MVTFNSCYIFIDRYNLNVAIDAFVRNALKNKFFNEWSNYMFTKQTQGPVLATYGRVLLNPLAAKVGNIKGAPQK
jgi:hypothetical protein